MKRTRRLACSAALVLTGVVPAENASARPAIVDLGVLGGDQSIAYGINDRGQIVGDSNVVDYELPLRAVLWNHDAMTVLGMLPGASGTSIGSLANGINNRGDVVGMSETASGEWHAVLWPR